MSMWHDALKKQAHPTNSPGRMRSNLSASGHKSSNNKLQPSFPRLHVHHLRIHIFTPTCRIPPHTHIPVITGPRPIVNAFDQPVFHRVVMDVINMGVQVILVKERVLPIPPLPHRLFPAFNTRFIPFIQNINPPEVIVRKMALYLIPPHWVIDVTLREAPNGVNMVGHQTNSHRFEGVLQLHVLPRSAQYFPADWICQDGLAVERHQGEEIGSAGLFESAIVGQSVCSPEPVMRSKASTSYILFEKTTQFSLGNIMNEQISLLKLVRLALLCIPQPR
jgi:hypothetical protein